MATAINPMNVLNMLVEAYKTSYNSRIPINARETDLKDRLQGEAQFIWNDVSYEGFL